MAHFYGSMQGSRGEATRCGTKESGITAHARGWKIGGLISVVSEVDTDEDSVEFFITRGSNGNATAYPIGTFTRADLERLLDGSLKLTLSEAEPKRCGVCARCGRDWEDLSGEVIGCVVHGIAMPAV